MSRNFYLEAQLKEAAAKAGALESALPDFEMDVQAFAITNASEIERWIEKCKTEKPHRFALQSDHDIELARSAFVDRNMTSQSRLYLAVGEQRFNDLKKLYAAGEPEGIKQKLNGSADHRSNPWSSHEDNLDQRGRYSAKALTRQGEIVKRLGERAAAGIAAAVGSRLGDTQPKRRVA